MTIFLVFIFTAIAIAVDVRDFGELKAFVANTTATDKFVNLLNTIEVNELFALRNGRGRTFKCLQLPCFRINNATASVAFSDVRVELPTTLACSTSTKSPTFWFRT
jgi:hypothetical protein